LENKQFVEDLLAKTVASNIDAISSLNANFSENVGPIPENDNVLEKFNNLVYSVDKIAIQAIEQANDLINAKINAYRSRIASGVRSNQEWGTLPNNVVDLIEYQAGITTDYLYGIKWYEYSFKDPLPFEITSGITTISITQEFTYAGLSTINVGFGSLGTINQTHPVSSAVRHYNVIGITTLNFTGGLTTTGIGSTGASFTNVTGLNYPNSYLISNNEILRVAGVGGTFVGFGINGEYRGFDGSQIQTHSNQTTFQIANRVLGIGSLSKEYPEIFDGSEYIKLRDGNYITLENASIVNPRLYLKINQINNSVVGISSGDYVGVGTELFYVNESDTHIVNSNITTLGIGSFIDIVSVPVTYNTGSTQFPLGSSNQFSPNENSGFYGVTSASAGTITAADNLVASTVASASTAATIIDPIRYLIPALNALREERSNYRIRKYGYDNSIVELINENQRIGIAVTFLSDKNYTDYMS